MSETSITPMLLDSYRKKFTGNTSAYGKYIYGKVTEEGEKRGGSATTELLPVMAEHYQKHLLGKQGLGIVPINEDDKCIFGVIDVDEYPIDELKVIKKIRLLNLPLVCFRSKSGGLHIYLFLKKPEKAVKVKEALFYMATCLGYHKVEIFPKQDKLSGSTGNWINLPYYDHENTKSYCYSDNGEALILQEAIDYINAMTIDPSDLDQITTDLPYSDAPPCLQHLISSGGAPDGMRNKYLFNVGVYLKQKHGDDYEKHLTEINNMQDNPLSLKELNGSVVKSLSRKEYFYLCEEEPICSHCNKEVCRSRKYGIDSDLMPDVIMGTLKKLATDPPIWTINIDGVDVTLTTEQMMDQRAYQRACVEHIHKYPKSLKPEKWRRLIQERLDTVVIEEAPEEAGTGGTFTEYLREFCTERTPARRRAEVVMGKVFSDDNFHYFKGMALQDFLYRNKGFRLYSPQMMYSKLRTMGGGSCKFSIETEGPKGKKERKQIRAYKVPIFEGFHHIDYSVEFEHLNIDDSPFG